MKTFIFQIFTSLVLGYLISTLISLMFIIPYKQSLHDELNFRRVEMVLDGFSKEQLNQSNKPIWLFQCDAASGEMQRVDEDKYTLTKRFGDREILGTFNSSAYNDEPIIKKIKLIEYLEDGIQILCTLLVLIVSLRTWTNGFQSLQGLSNRYAQGDFKARAENQGPEAIKTLIANQHQMASAIDGLMTRQKMIFAALPHDIRTPLSAIQLTSDMLVERGNSDSFLLNRLDEQVSSLNTLCESSLHLLKILNKQVPLERVWVNFSDVVTSTTGSLIGSRDIEMVNCHRQVQTDPKILKILLLNILSNAFRYSSDKVELMFNEYPNFDVVKINDDGVGFGDEIVRAFNRGEIDNITPQDGFGIGMLLTYEIALHLNGKAMLANHENGGQVVLIMNR